MFIKKVTLNGFRNFSEITSHDFVEGKNLIYGLNGSGKTSILESIYFLGFGKSFLNVKKSEVLNENSSEFFISSSIINQKGNSSLSCSYSKDFSHFKNKKKIASIEAINCFYPLFFSSANYINYIESISLRRKMINRFMYGIDNYYADAIILYGRALKQKKMLLKKGGDFSQLSSWNRIMGEKMSIIIEKRNKFIEGLNSKLFENSDGNKIKIVYNPSVSGYSDSAGISEQLEAVKEKEINFGKTLIGTHLDKFSFFLNGKALKFFSSGEKKFYLILIYLAFIEVFKTVRDEFPVFLIDDFDTAMDKENLAVLYDKYPDIQVISTSVNRWKNFDHLIKIKS